jgi:hypothetical protein
MRLAGLALVAASSVAVEGLLLGPGAALRPPQPQLARQVRLRCCLGAVRLPVQLSGRLLNLCLLCTQSLARMAEAETEAEEMTEEEYMAELAKEQGGGGAKELSSDAKKVYWNMRSVTGVEFAPWMQVDPEAIAKAEKERKARKERAALSAEEIDGLSLDPQAAELGAGACLVLCSPFRLFQTASSRMFHRCYFPTCLLAISFLCRRWAQVEGHLGGGGRAEVVDRQRGGQQRLHCSTAEGRCVKRGCVPAGRRTCGYQACRQQSGHTRRFYLRPSSYKSTERPHSRPSALVAFHRADASPHPPRTPAPQGRRPSLTSPRLRSLHP